ncbi:hypothetical protein LTR48_002920 [Friedmanniomyces endolithicus]|uniref:Aminotransferase class I/classII large domain-containing protein n=1 Tax=Rachicladosporium monterosium TaxID=1507873 RepID=A0ABR0L9J8_9PEZI|nr:hypothetical protein LTR48_002920 [Friedmanniomyces endolithicus]KAK5145574.1 hypothetical protein LTR32_002706 [Rachicladosporium monterosium]
MESSTKKSSGLEATLSRTLDKRRSSSTIRQLTTTAPNAVDFSSNDFLSLATNPELRHSFLQELERGPPNTGSGGSRLLDGNSTYAEALERQIATFHNAPAGLLCNSGFDANVGLFSCLPQPGDIIIHDSAIHASVHDGMRLSRAAQCLPFAHNDTTSLRAVLQTCVASDPTILHGQRNIFVAVETVYSMDGDLAPLRAIVALLRDKTLLPASNAYLVVDEAHSTGLYGAQGRGLVCELGLENDVTYLVNYARPLIYTTFMSFPALAGVKASYAFLASGRAEALRRNLMGVLVPGLHARLLALQDELAVEHGVPSELLRVPSECPSSPIFAVLSSEPKALAAYCQSKGFVVRGIVPPTVDVGTERIRVCLHGGNTVEQLDGLIAVIGAWVHMRRAQTMESRAEVSRASL